ncbi:MAG: heparinase II/III family protein [Rhizobiaceae bacterium]|nr:heparinase II/III family protein [Rhizobiaceae bacterium]
MALLDKPKLISISAGRKYQSFRRALRRGVTALTGFSASVPDQISIAPTDLRTPDTQIVQEFYQGRYVLAGHTVFTEGKSPFSIEHASTAWMRELHRFGWLRHFSASKEGLAINNAQATLNDWLEGLSMRHETVAWDIEIASERLIYWLCHSDILVTGVNHEYYRMLMRALGAHVRFLKRHAPTAPSGMQQLLSYLALSYASICHSNQLNSLKFAREKLSSELDWQILTDGGHISRNPQAIVKLLALLLPFKQACVAVGVEPPAGVITAIERMLPALRFFRLGDGNLARFNGGGVTESDLLVTLLRYDEMRGEPIQYAPKSGYQRMTLGSGIVILDVGDAPKGELSSEAHAGCLAFEFSQGQSCILINCGTPSIIEDDAVAVWRSTAAHNASVLNETSSCRFENRSDSPGKINGQILTPKLGVETERNEIGHAVQITSAHVGYNRDFGVRHQRTLTLEENGTKLSGNDWFTAPDKGDLRYAIKDKVKIHFHLHPDIHVANELPEENAFILVAGNSEQWKFSCKEAKPSSEESIFFSHLSGTRKTTQITLSFEAGKVPEVSWVLEKI